MGGGGEGRRRVGLFWGVGVLLDLGFVFGVVVVNLLLWFGLVWLFVVFVLCCCYNPHAA